MSRERSGTISPASETREARQELVEQHARRYVRDSPLRSGVIRRAWAG